MTAPTVTGVTPNSGLDSGLQQVGVYGTGFATATACKFGATSLFYAISANAYTQWNWPGSGYTDFTWDLKPLTDPGSGYFWSHQFSFGGTTPSTIDVTGCSFSPSSNVITRASGSFISDGVLPGMLITDVTTPGNFNPTSGARPPIVETVVDATHITVYPDNPLGTAAADHLEFAYQAPNGGYFGIQPDSGSGKIAIFSVFGGIAATAGTGATAGQFTNEGTGWNLKIPYAWSVSTTYELQVKQGPSGSGWWGAYITDTGTSTTTYLGEIQVPPTWGDLDGPTICFTEFFGAQPGACALLAHASAQWTRPTANSGSVTPLFDGSGGNGSHTNSTQAGRTCTNSASVDVSSFSAGQTQHDVGTSTTLIPSFGINGNGQISAVTPSGAGVVDVTVTNPDGTSATSTADRYTYLSTVPPVLLEMTPNSGTVDGGTPVTILGNHFTGTTVVAFGPNAATSLVVVSDTEITCDTPAGTGHVNVTVISPEGSSPSWSGSGFTYTSDPPPGIIKITPDVGVPAGGTPITIVGTNFSSPAEVDIGGHAATSIVVVSTAEITCDTPAGSLGTVDVTVVTSGGESPAWYGARFTYQAAVVPTVTLVSPSGGPAAGGTGSLILGTGFTGATDVQYGADSAASFLVEGDTILTAYSPAHAAGTVDITVVTDAGTSSTSSADEFTYVSAPPTPTVTGLSVSDGPSSGGTSVVITGTGFTGMTATDFGTHAAFAIVVSDTQINAVSPAGSMGEVHVTVTTPGGTSAETSADLFLYTAEFDMPTLGVAVSFVRGPGGPNWTDVSGYVFTVQTQTGKQHELDRFEAGTATVLLNNAELPDDPAGRFSPFNNEGPFFNQLSSADADFESGIGSWTVFTNCTISSSSDIALHFTRSLKMVAVASGTMTAQTGVLYNIAEGADYSAFAAFIPEHPDHARTIQCGISWWDPTKTTNISTDIATGTEIGGVWVQCGGTWTAPAGAAYAQVFATVESTTDISGETHYVDGAALFYGTNGTWVPGTVEDQNGGLTSGALVPMVPIQITAAWDGVTYPIWAGYVDSWHMQWPGPAFSDVVVSASDALKGLNVFSVIGTVYQTVVLADSPTVLYPCDDSEGSTTLTDAGPFNETANLVNEVAFSGHLDATMSMYGGGALLSDPTAGWMQLSTISVVEVPSVILEGGTNGTFEAWVLMTADSLIFSTLSGFQVYSNGGLLAAGFSTGTFVGSSSGPSLIDNAWHHVVVVVDALAGGGTVTGYVDGQEQFSTGGMAGSFAGDLSFIYVGNADVIYAPQVARSPDLAQNIAIYGLELSSSQVLNHYNAAKSGWPGQYTGARVASILEPYTNALGAINCDTGVCVIQPMALQPSPSSLLTLINTVLDTEEGRFYQDFSGNLWFRQRDFVSTNPRSLTPQVVIDDESYLDGVQYAPSSPDLIVDDTDLWNQAVISAQDFTDIIIEDAASIARFFTRVIQRSTFHVSAEAQTEHGTYLVGKYRYPVPRVQSLVVSLLSNGIGPNVIPYMLALEFFDQVLIQRHPMDSPGSFSQYAYVEGTAHDIAWNVPEPHWTMTINLSALG